MSVVNSGFNVSAPGSGPTAAAGTASGNLTASSVYGYKVTFVTGFGETTPSSAGTVTTSSTGSVNLTAIPVSSDICIIARNVYRTTAGGSTYELLATIHDNVTTTFTDTTSDSGLGAAAPTVNTAYSRQTINGVVKHANPSIFSVENGITAHAGGGQASAYQLTAEYSFVGTVATTADSVRLPQLTSNLIGTHILVANDGANSLNVFPASGQDASAGADTAVAVAAAARAEFVAKSATAWEKTR